jgi:hypothetical protein
MTAKRLRHKPNTPTSPPRLADRRTLASRRFQQIVERVLADLGETKPIEVKVQLVRRYAAAIVMAEALETDLLNEEPIDAQRFMSLIALINRMSARLGLKSDEKEEDEGETLASYLAQRDARKALEPVERVSEAPARELAPVAAPTRQQQDDRQ